MTQSHYKKRLPAVFLTALVPWILFYALAGATTDPAPAGPVVLEPETAVDCGRLPTREEFINTDYGKETIRKIQQCLRDKGYLSAPAHGLKSPLTIAALDKYQAWEKPAPAPEIDCNALPSKEQFIKQEYDARSIKFIQGCLAARGFYKGGIDGMRSEALNDALDRSRSAEKEAKNAAGRVGCASLPTQAEFIKAAYDRKSIEIIQGCLWEKRYYTGPIDGLKGPLTIAALGRRDRGEPVPAPARLDGKTLLACSLMGGGDAASVPGLAEAGLFTSFILTSADLEEMNAANEILDKLRELSGLKFENSDELKSAVNLALDSITGKYGKSLAMALGHVEYMKNPKLTEQEFKAFKEFGVPDSVIGSLRELQDVEFPEKSLLVKAVNAKLNAAGDPYRFLLIPILNEVNNLKANSLPDDFFMKIEEMRIPAPVRKRLGRIRDVEYANGGLFVNALENLVLSPLEKEIGKDSFDTYKSLLLAKAAKEHLFDKEKRISWEGWPHGCFMEDFSGVTYGFYPFWNAGGKQKIDFSALARIGYFAVTFNGKGELTGRADWEPGRAAFIEKARQYRAKTDLVIYRNDWRNWREFITAPESSLFSKKLVDSIVDAVTQKVTDSPIEKVKRILSFGCKPLPSMGDGVTIFFDRYPEDKDSVKFFQAFISNLRVKLNASDKHFSIASASQKKHLSIVLPLQSVNKLVYLNNQADFFLILLEEPTTDVKKSLRDQVEKLFTGEPRRDTLRKIIPVIPSVGHDYDNDAEKQLDDDLIYYQDNFGGVGFWPLPIGKDSGAAGLNTLIKKRFSYDPKLYGVENSSGKENPANHVVQEDYLQQVLRRHAPWFGNIVGPYRWTFRIAFDLLLFSLLGYAVLSYWVFEMRDLASKHLWLFGGACALALLLQACLFLEDPFWRGKTTVVLFAALAIGGGMGILFYLRKIKQKDLP